MSWVRVSEHQSVARRCDRGKVTGGIAPAGVEAPVSYGPRTAAIIVYLYLGQFLSKTRAAQALAELLGTPVRTGTVVSITRRAAAGLNGYRAHSGSAGRLPFQGRPWLPEKPDRLALICSWLAIAHSASAITSGTSDRPSSVTSYSTRGGTSA